MKLLPLTLTLFDKVTNNTYKGTVFLKNLETVNASANGNKTIDEEIYDGKGAGLFIVLVISVYALSIVLFIASFITKKEDGGDKMNEESTVTTYLHKVGDLKEKTAREHFKKLKNAMISQVEADSNKVKEVQKRAHKSSKGAKDMASISKASSKSSLGEHRINGIDRKKAPGLTETIPSTGLLPRRDDAKQPLLSTEGADSPATPNMESPRLHPEKKDPSMQRASSSRFLTPNEIDSEKTDDSDEGRYYPNKGPPGSRRKGTAPSSKGLRPFESMPSVHGEAGKKFTQPIASSARDIPQSGGWPIERPRPRHSAPKEDAPDVWHQMPHKIMPPPPPKPSSKKNPKNLQLDIPNLEDQSDVWVLRNGGRLGENEKDMQLQPIDRHNLARVRQPNEQQTMQRPRMYRDNADVEKRKREKSPLGRSLLHSQGDLSSPEQSPLPLSLQENKSLPKPFRSPSPRTPTEKHPSQSSLRPRSNEGLLSHIRDKDRGTVRVTLDQSPGHSPKTASPILGLPNSGYNQSPNIQKSPGRTKDDSPQRQAYNEGARNLEVRPGHFPMAVISQDPSKRREEHI